MANKNMIASPQNELDLSEKGKDKDGQPISMNRRLFVQFLAYGHCADPAPLVEQFEMHGIEAAIYADANDPQGIGLVTLTEDPNFYVDTLRPILNQPKFSQLTFKPEYTMLGRTYAIGYEPDLVEALIDRPKRKMLNPELQWGVWYPLQRVKNFENLPEKEQQIVLMEHGGIGMRFGKAGLATDIRLACHGMDKNDNDFVIGILAHDLYPASMVVQAMRKTKQTSLHLETLGPFFVGKVIWQSKIS